jgi:hypothetical protein
MRCGGGKMLTAHGSRARAETINIRKSGAILMAMALKARLMNMIISPRQTA